jgi:hypothetical protein
MSESPLSQFVRIWCHPSYPPDSVQQTDLEAVEKRYSFLLPESYKQEVLSVGLPRPTAALLNSIVELELELADVSNFLSPVEIVERTEGWRDINLPKNLIAFAADCSGNLFAFETQSGASATVWFFDHDSGEVSEAATDFANWIERFCRIEPVVE